MTGDDRGSTNPTEHGPRELLDTREHPRFVALGLLLILVLMVGGVLGLASSLGSGGKAEVVQVVVPRSAGRTAVAAQTQLERLGLIVEIEYESNELIASGTVVSQNPIAGSRLEVGQLVTLAVSDGPAGIEVPDLRGLHGAEAAALLQTVGLPSKGEQIYDDAVRVGEVVGSNPATGARATPGSTVVIKVSKGPAPRTVPPVVDVSDAEAMVAIARAELKIGKISYKTGSGKPGGTIISTSPGAGAQVPRNMPVNLVIARDPGPVLVPDLVGLTSAVAQQVARDAGVRVSEREQAVPAGDSRDGLVVSQSPVAGTAVGAGGSMTIQVGLAPEPPPTTVPPSTDPTRGGSPAPGSPGD